MPEHPPRDDNETTTSPCPICGNRFTPVRRQRYCTNACRQIAHRRRHHATEPPEIPATAPRRVNTVYICQECEQRYLGEQWCPDCNRPCRRLGTGGNCPHCLLTELADVAGVSFPAALLHLDAWPTSTASLKLILR